MTTPKKDPWAGWSEASESSAIANELSLDEDGRALVMDVLLDAVERGKALALAEVASRGEQLALDYEGNACALAESDARSRRRGLSTEAARAQEIADAVWRLVDVMLGDTDGTAYDRVHSALLGKGAAA